MDAAGSMIDWQLAVSVGSRLAGDGPPVTAPEAHRVVAELRAGAERSTGLVRDFTGLVAAEHTAPVLVVDRAGWVQANADGFRTVLAPVVDRLMEKRPPNALARAVGSRITGLELGGMLGFLAGKVLGQFDPFHDPQGRLLLVAPNIVHVERELDVHPSDFRLWVCLHEETHRVQFTAVPWMRDHLFSLVQKLADTMDSARLDEVLGRVAEVVRGRDLPPEGVLGLVSTPEQRALLDEATAVMSLLEGHADVVMDGVGPRVIPTVEDIRAAFDRRRQGAGSLDRLMRRLLGLEAKMAQYRDGAAFVRGVVDRVGMERFNAVFAGPDHLPTRAEIADPQAWVARVL